MKTKKITIKITDTDVKAYPLIINRIAIKSISYEIAFDKSFSIICEVLNSQGILCLIGNLNYRAELLNSPATKQLISYLQKLEIRD